MLRATRLDGCGNVKLGPSSKVVTEGIITVGLTANNEEGETISQTNAAGKNCILDEPIPKFLNFTVEVTMCGVHPDLFHLLTGQPVVLNAAGDEAIGFGVDDDIDLENSGVALELWSNVPADSCEGGAALFGYVLLPFLKGGTIGDLTWENAAINFVVTGAKTKKGNGWGVGPYDVELDETDEPGPLNVAIPTSRHMHTIKTSVPPPEETDGGDELGVPATGANVTSTTAAVLSPANSYPPEDLAALLADPVTATPSTAWATGKYLLLGDGSKAHWNATLWVAGVA
jgi:hypothetical protein